MEWFKMPVNLIDDPVTLRFSPSEFRAWMTALAYAARQETDGIYQAVGPLPAVQRSLVDKGGLVPTGDPETFEVYGWDRCMPTRTEISRRRVEARERMARAREVRANFAGSHSDVPTSLSISTSSSVVNGSQLQRSGHPAPGRRDEPYEAFGDCWQGDWHGLPEAARGRINEALGSLRNMTENREKSDEELAGEIRRRWAIAVAWHPEWDWTPQTFLRYWRRVQNPVKAAGKPSRAQRTAAEALALREAGQ